MLIVKGLTAVSVSGGLSERCPGCYPSNQLLAVVGLKLKVRLDPLLCRTLFYMKTIAVNMCPLVNKFYEVSFHVGLT